MKLEDIAARAGVSRSTVSRVINDEPYVSQRTRDKVMAVIEAMGGYSPNPAARMLVTQRTQVIGVVIPRTLSVVFEDTGYFPTILQGITEAAKERDYATLLWLGHSDEDEERFYKRVLRNRLMDGLIIASATSDYDVMDMFLHNDITFVMTECPRQHIDQISYVTVDNAKAAEEAVLHLLEMGRRRIATITGGDNPDGQDRLAGYYTALQKAGIPANPEWVVEGSFSRMSGYLGMRQLLNQGIDALFAANDSMAAGALDTIKEAGLSIPEDIAIVGFDDGPEALASNPTLSTVRQPIQQKGYRATKLLFDLIEGKVTGAQQILLPTQLVIRASTGIEIV